MIVNHNALSQVTIREQGGEKQLLMLLDKATLPKLRISIICTLWSLTGTDSNSRQDMACKKQRRLVLISQDTMIYYF